MGNTGIAFMEMNGPYQLNYVGLVAVPAASEVPAMQLIGFGALIFEAGRALILQTRR